MQIPWRWGRERGEEGVKREWKGVEGERVVEVIE
jgi:hypothetical protein